MKIVIFHYHLNPGGVTRIIDLQIESLKLIDSNVQITIVTGFCPNKDYYQQKGIELIENDELNYLSETSKNLVDKSGSIYTFFRKTCKPGGILHAHNLNLGKNPLVTLAVSKLANEGYAVINHAHDFSEDRPDNQQFLKSVIEGKFGKDIREIMYPDLNNYYVAVLNSYDFNRLSEFGMHTNRCFLLPNPVFLSQKHNEKRHSTRDEITDKLGIDVSKLIVTYPVRVIHRKNISEFILLTVLFRHQGNFVVTQAPKNPNEIHDYALWKEFSFKENIPITWEAGTKVNFEQLVQVSDFCITTSVREGFGMVYLEPWLLDTPVIGRDIPHVTSDLKKSGVVFPTLYSKLLVNESQEIFDLTISSQMEYICELNKSIIRKEFLLNLNPFLKDLFNPVDKALIRKNKGVILSNYSLKKYGQSLYEIYRRIIKQP